MTGMLCIRYNGITFETLFSFILVSLCFGPRKKERQVVSLNINTQQLRYFMELARCLNFTRAAANLYVAQPTLSQQIAELESQLGVTLFTRSSRSVTLTPAGKILQEAYPELEARMEQVQQHMLITAAGFSGIVTVGFLEAFLGQMPAFIRTFKTEFPDIVIKPVSGNPNMLRSGLKNQTMDIALSLIPELGPGPHAALESRVTLHDPLCFVLPADHPASSDTSFAASMPLVSFSDAAATCYTSHIHDCLKKLELQVPGVIYVDSPRDIQVYLEAGLGFSVLPSSFAAYFTAPLQFIPIPGEYLDFGILWDPNSTNPALPLLLDALEQHMGPDPGTT